MKTHSGEVTGDHERIFSSLPSSIWSLFAELKCDDGDENKT